MSEGRCDVSHFTPVFLLLNIVNKNKKALCLEIFCVREKN